MHHSKVFMNNATTTDNCKSLCILISQLTQNVFSKNIFHKAPHSLPFSSVENCEKLLRGSSHCEGYECRDTYAQDHLLRVQTLNNIVCLPWLGNYIKLMIDSFNTHLYIHYTRYLHSAAYHQDHSAFNIQSIDDVTTVYLQ